MMDNTPFHLREPLKEIEVLQKALHDACKQLLDPEPLPSFLHNNEQSYVDYFVSRVRMGRRDEHRQGEE